MRILGQCCSFANLHANHQNPNRKSRLRKHVLLTEREGTAGWHPWPPGSIAASHQGRCPCLNGVNYFHGAFMCETLGGQSATVFKNLCHDDLETITVCLRVKRANLGVESVPALAQ